MSTAYIYRILLLYPHSRYYEIEEWYAWQFPGAGDLLSPIGTKDGEQWYASSFVATASVVDKWIEVLAANLGSDVPLNFTSLPREYQRIGIESLGHATLANLGFYISGCFNDEGEIADYHHALSTIGIPI